MPLSCTTPNEEQSLFYDHYERYKQENLDNRRFTQEAILPLIASLDTFSSFSVKPAGKTVLGKDIFLVSIGKGEKSVLLWSQMHGDESTATMALMDIFNFFKETDELDAMRKLLLEKLTIHFIPMLNPDGAEEFKRRNALDIDLNRDALRLQSPEAKLLKAIRDSTNADYGFNLHDQNTRYTAGKSSKPATISFLAPAFDEAKTISKGRENAMKLIVDMTTVLQKYIPGQVAKYSDEFEPRAFGDNIQKWGTNTVLIESGGYPQDPQKQYIRKLNFVAIMEGLKSIALEAYKKNSTDQYFAIPNNDNYLYDLIIREVLVTVNDKDFTVDLGINRAEINGKGKNAYYYKSSIADVGDLSVFFGYEELPANSMRAIPGKIYPYPVKDLQELNALDYHQLILEGYTSVQMDTLPEEESIQYPLNIVQKGSSKNHPIAENASPNFVLTSDGAVKYAIINGFIYDVTAREKTIPNALVEQ